MYERKSNSYLLFTYIYVIHFYTIQYTLLEEHQYKK